MPYFSATVTTDSSGDATVTSWSGAFQGLLLGVRIDGDGYDSGADITISEPRGLARTILTLTDTNTDTKYNPQDEVDDTSGSGLGTYTPFYVDSTNLQVVIAQGGDTTTGTVYLLVLETS